MIAPQLAISAVAGAFSISFKIRPVGPSPLVDWPNEHPQTCAPVNDQLLYLVDSGGQYLDGTTDITRTVHLGQPTEFQRESFTRVLQGHIDLAQAGAFLASVKTA